MIPIPKEGPAREKRRQEFLARRLRRDRTADRYRERLIELYGRERASRIEYVEAFEICEYGRRPSKEDIKKLLKLSQIG